jgi:hypothetical protein
LETHVRTQHNYGGIVGGRDKKIIPRPYEHRYHEHKISKREFFFKHHLIAIMFCSTAVQSERVNYIKEIEKTDKKEIIRK